MTLPLAVQEIARSSAEGRLVLWGDLSLADPVFLLLIPLALLAVVLGTDRRRHSEGRASVMAPVPPSLAQRLAFLRPVLQGIALVLVILSLARPLRIEVDSMTTSEGVDIVLLLDTSSSMEARRSAGEPTRFEIVKDVVGDFSVRRMTDREGAADNICLIGFALYPRLLCPFTLDVNAVTGVLAELTTEQRRELDATGIGIALAKAVEVLQSSDAESRVVVLLTDGKENVEVIQPLESAQLAAEQGIKVYTVFAGPTVIERPRFSGLVQRMEVDTSELQKVAELTEGRFFQAESREDLEEVYGVIEELERTEREDSQLFERFDLYPWLLLPGFLLYLLTGILSQTLWRRLP